MKPDPDFTRTVNHADRTGTFDHALEAGLAAAFGPNPTPGGWSQPPLLRDDPSEHAPLVQPSSAEMPRGSDERYQLLGEIARGGMGVVLKGRDPDLGRDIAFKVLRQELSGKPAAVQRFVEEAQVGGQLQHPGIVPVYDIGRFSDGRPYFAMKLVKGRTLADLLAERTDPAVDRGRYLRHFLQVCQTLAYAHSKGVIHRDLKPSNVMVGAFDEVLVMDWGLAKVLPRGGVADEEKASRASEHPTEGLTEIKTARFGSGSETEAGSVLGTPAFMPPEQAGGEIDKLDERADVFGLGAVLCVILTGKPPYVAASGDALRLMAVRGQLDECFARLDACGADAELLALCRRSLSVIRDSRPRDAGGLAAAVSGYLAGVEDRARRAELDRAAAAAEAIEQRKRRKVQLALAASLMLLLCGGVGFGWWQDRQASARRAEQASRDRDERERLDRNADVLRILVDRCEDALRREDAEAAMATLEEIERRQSDGGSEEFRPRMQRCRADATLLDELNRIEIERWTLTDGELRGSVALASRKRLEALEKYGIVMGATNSKESIRRIEESLVRERIIGALDLALIYDRLNAQPNTLLWEFLCRVDRNEYRNALRTALHNRSGTEVRTLLDQPEALTQPIHFSIAIGALPVLHDNRRKALESAWGRKPGDLQLLLMLGGQSSASGTNRNDPEKLARNAAVQLRWYQAAVAAHPKNSYAWSALGSALSNHRNYEEAIFAFQEALRLDGKNSTARNNMAIALRDKGDIDGALREFRKTFELNPKYHGAHANFAWLIRRRGELDLAIEHFREAVRLEPRSSYPQKNLASALIEKNDLDGAIAQLREAVKLIPTEENLHADLWRAIRTKHGYDRQIAEIQEYIKANPESAMGYNQLGLAYKGRNQDLDAAICAFRQSIRLQAPSPWNDVDLSRSLAHREIGLILLSQEKLDEAQVEFRRAIELNPSSIANGNLADILMSKGEWSQAIRRLQEAVRNDPSNSNLRNSLGNALTARGELHSAIYEYREALRLSPKASGILFGLGRALAAIGEDAEAADQFQACLQLRPKDHLARVNLGVMLGRLGDTKGAIREYEECIRILPDFALALNNLAWIRATDSRAEFRDGAQAVRLAIRACELMKWSDPISIDTLAAAYAESGDFDKAIEYQNRAKGFPEFEKEAGGEIRHKLYLFTIKRPYREVVRPLAPPPREMKR